MAEPIQTGVAVVSLMTLATAIFGPKAGPYIVILLASVGGALWALSSAELATRMQGAWLLLRCVLTAVVLTSIVAQTVGAWLHTPPSEAVAVVAFCIGALGNKWLEIIDALKTRIAGLVSTGAKP